MERMFPDLITIKTTPNNIPNKLIEFAEFLDMHLPIEWEIFVHPFVNSEIPDLAMLNPNVGVVLFQLFDEIADNYSAEIKKVSSERNSYKKKVLYRNRNKSKKYVQNPMDVLDLLSEHLINIYVPDIGHAAKRNDKVYRVVKKILYAPNISKHDGERLFKRIDDEKNYYVFTKEDLIPSHFKLFYDSVLISKTYPLEKAWYNEFKFWFNPPYHNITDGERIKFIENQRNFAFHQPQKCNASDGNGIS